MRSYMITSIAYNLASAAGLDRTQETSGMLGELLPTGGGDPIPLLKEKLLIGRRDGCDISLRFPNVSSHHCELEFVNGYWRVRDLGSSNGTKVNGVRIETQWLLPGDQLSVAKHRYEVKYSPKGEVPEPEMDTFTTSLLEKAGLAKQYSKPANGTSEEAAPKRAPRGIDLEKEMEELWNTRGASRAPKEEDITQSLLDKAGLNNRPSHPDQKPR